MYQATDRDSANRSHNHSFTIIFLGILFLSGVSSTLSIASGLEFKDCPSCPVMVAVPAGEFLMGFDGGEPLRYEGPVRKVTIKQRFAIGKFEVTNAQYRQFITETGHR
jgi:formylglycine-generating enzyme required for sulfatase activity